MPNVRSQFLYSSNFVEKLCGEWVLSASVCGTGSFSAHTATHSISENAHETQNFSTELRKTKKCQRTIVANQQLFLLAQHKNLCYNKNYENETMDLNGGNHEKN